MQTYQEIQDQIKKLQKQADDIRKKELASIINSIKGQIQEYGLTARDLGLETRKKAVQQTAIKYRKGNNAWSGRGRQPRWIAEHLAAGGKLDDLLV